MIGAGSWGTALALTAHRAGRTVTLHPRRPEHAEDMRACRENREYLAGASLPADLTIDSSLDTLPTAHAVVLVTPAQTYRNTASLLQGRVNPTAPLIICSKGIDLQDNRLLSDILRDILPNPIAILSGPSFANEVGENLPTAVSVASDSQEVSQRIAGAIRHPYFRAYACTDPIGVQIAGAVKNVLAIACGIVRGRQLGNNAAAALITRGLAEMRRLGLAMGGQSETFLGLAAVGDLTLTASNLQSRNMSLGYALGQGKSLEEILQDRKGVTEGIATAKAVVSLAKKYDTALPICQGVYQILYEGYSIGQTIDATLSRQSDIEIY